MNYEEFLLKKSQLGTFDGFDPVWIPGFLFPFQQDLLSWAIRKGRCALFEDCGLGKTPQQLVWAENLIRKTNGNVLIITPLAVSLQTIAEGEKFGIEVKRSDDGKAHRGITVTNYERLHHFNPDDFVGIVCDESSILKNFDGAYKKLITEFMRKKPYRLLCTATASPNDYIELGTSSEAIGELGYMDMLGRFFKNEQSTISTSAKIKRFNDTGHYGAQWRFKKHAETHFWKWVSSWARAIRKPSDIGCNDGDFILPPLIERQSIVANERPLNGELFIRPVKGLKEQREELRLTIKQRCERVAEIVNSNGCSLVWCNLNDEGDLLENIIPDAVQVAGCQSDEEKEEKLIAFSRGQIKRLITKPKIAGFGMNWQHCNHVTFFPSHSFEQYYQGVRRCWRFGQKNPVIVDIITTDGEVSVLKNMQKKAKAADKMFTELIAHMNDSMRIDVHDNFKTKVEEPSWL